MASWEKVKFIQICDQNPIFLFNAEKGFFLWLKFVLTIVVSGLEFMIHCLTEGKNKSWDGEKSSGEIWRTFENLNHQHHWHDKTFHPNPTQAIKNWHLKY